jgi:hypothetical protein
MHHAARLVLAYAAASLLVMLLAIPLSTHAAVIAVANGDAGARIELHDTPGPCVDKALLALFIRGNQQVPGCWITGAGQIQIAWLDGDTTLVSMNIFRAPQGA